METDITETQAREILESPGYDAYGTLRLYCVYSSESVYSGQIGSVKSVYQLEQAIGEGVARLYSKGNNGMVPIGRA